MTLFLTPGNNFSTIFQLVNDVDRAWSCGFNTNTNQACRKRSNAPCQAPASQCCARNSPALVRAALKDGSSFNPRFDVAETADGYQLTGDLPGIRQSNVHVEWVNDTTLRISGHTQSEHTETNIDDNNSSSETYANQVKDTTEKSAAIPTSDTTAAENDEAKNHDEAENTSRPSSYHAPTVEEDDQSDDFENISHNDGDSNEKQKDHEDTTMTTNDTIDASASKNEDSNVASNSKHTPANRANNNGYRYWISERRSGRFARSFVFPQRVEHSGVKARLRDGVLTVVVPKAVERAPRRIRIE